MKAKLHEIIAIETQRSAEATAIVAETITTLTKKHEHFLGSLTTYTPFAEEDAHLKESSSKEVDTTVRKKLDHCFKIVGNALDVTISKDATNQLAKASVEIDGEVIASDLPATALLTIETNLKKWLEILLAIPTLAPGRDWTPAPNKGEGVYVDPTPEESFRTRKDPQFRILVPATDHHPAQVTQWNEDIKIGKKSITSWSSMLSLAEKSAIIGRCQELLAAVKQARQRANCQEVVDTKVSASLVRFILGQ